MNINFENDIFNEPDDFVDPIFEEAKQVADIYRSGDNEGFKKGYNKALTDIYNFIEDYMILNGNDELKKIADICVTWKK